MLLTNIPMLLTLLRILLIPFFILVYFLPFSWAHPFASLLFAFAALTDWLDGYLARSLGQSTQLGAFLDPVADKLLVACALVIVVGHLHVPGLSIAAAVIVMREIAISALREWMAEMGKRTSVAVNRVAKIKTAIQMTALILLIWYAKAFSNVWILWSGVVLLFFAAGLTLWSMIIYIRVSWSGLTLSQERQ